MSDDAKRGEGWGWPLNSMKAHWFDGARSLCGRWMFFGECEPDKFKSTDDCKECRRRLDKRKAATS